MIQLRYSQGWKMAKSKKKKTSRKYTESEIQKLKGTSIFVELDMPSSKYHKSILKTTLLTYYNVRWISLDAPELPRRLTVHFSQMKKTKETKCRLTNSPTILKDELFKDFSGYEISIGDVLFGNGRIIKITDIKPTICIAKVLHPTSKWHQKTFRSSSLLPC